MTRDEIAKEFDRFFEFDTDDRSTVTSTSARLFAEHIVRLLIVTKREPLTIETINKLWNDAVGWGDASSNEVEFVRAIERAHGIGGGGMSRDDIINMARETGMISDSHAASMTSFLERFAALVAAAEREQRTFELAESYRCGWDGGVLAEREACAKACESLFDPDDDTCNEAETCAAAIRARKGK